MFSTDADLFFEPPTNHRPPPNTYGLLHLLRRDVIQCLGRNPTTNQPTPCFMALWPAAMAICAGIDLLAKYVAGSDTGSVARRYKDYLIRFAAPLNEDDPETLYQFRNSLIHSFGLYSVNRQRVYRFTMSNRRRQLLSNGGADTCNVDLSTLHDRFEKSISRYQTELDADPSLQSNFGKMFLKYGSVRYG